MKATKGNWEEEQVVCPIWCPEVSIMAVVTSSVAMEIFLVGVDAHVGCHSASIEWVPVSVDAQVEWLSSSDVGVSPAVILIGVV